MKEIELKIEQRETVPGSEIDGTVTVNYEGRFDGVQVNTYIVGANENVLFTNLNGKAVSLLARLFVSSDMMGDKKSFHFKAMVQESVNSSKIRFRAAMIQQHKEIASDTLFLSVVKE